MTVSIEIAGERFGRLMALDSVPSKRGRIWRCHCDCGAETHVPLCDLRSGATKSCGCFHRERARILHTTHGGRGSSTYRSWEAMRYRCSNPKSDNWKYYGGRGISVSERWLNDFAAFFADMGPRPTPDHSIDRWPDPDGNYEPTNCRWATQSEQRRNRRCHAGERQ